MSRVQQPRGIAVIAYLLFALAGVFFMFWSPSIGIRMLLGAWGFYAWNWFLLLGGGFGILGAWRRNFRIEIIAVPFLCSGSAAYAVSLAARVNQTPSPGALLGLSSIFLGLSFLLVGQGYVLLKRIRIANDMIKRAADG